MTLEVIVKNFDSLKNSEGSRFEDSLLAAIETAFVEKFVQGDERPCEKDDFENSKKVHEMHIVHLNQIIDHLVTSDYFDKSQESHLLNTKLVASILIICGENAQCKPWNTEKTVKTCELILQKILKVFNCCDVSKLIVQYEGRRLLKETLKKLRPKLLADTWKQYPSAVASYQWILQKIEQPELSYHLPTVLPTALLLVDDFINDNKIIGIKCLHHIINNLTLAELQYHGHGDVIYNALLPLSRIREVEVINNLMPCLILLAYKLETDIGKKKFAKWSKFDDVLEIFLENMELETQIDLRDSFIRNLLLILNASSIEIMRWGKRLFRIFKEYLETAGKFSDDLTFNICLKAVTKFVEITEPAYDVYAKDLFFILLGALYHVTNEQTELQKENKIVLIGLIIRLNNLKESDKEDLKIAFKKTYLRNAHYIELVRNLLNL